MHYITKLNDNSYSQYVSGNFLKPINDRVCELFNEGVSVCECSTHPAVYDLRKDASVNLVNYIAYMDCSHQCHIELVLGLQKHDIHRFV